MGVVEKAAGSVHDITETLVRSDVAHAGKAQSFDLDYSRFAEIGLYRPDVRDSQLALELRAVKRRLLRRIGFLRASGERQAFRMPGRQRNLVLVTSTRAGEGKTFCATNLALSLALEDQIDTLLIDADVPRPKVRAQFGLPAARGLTDVLLDGSIPPSGVQYRANQAPLTIMPEGASVDRSSDLFAGEAAERLFAQLSRQAPDQMILIDAPPVLATTDAVVLAKYVDEIIFVVESNTTPEPAVASAIDELLDINPNVNLMLNRCMIGAGGSHYGSYEYYGSSPVPSENGRRTAQMEGPSDGEV
ncbi:MAG: hypothetical protein DHS20C05_19640 [Hyphococcus sp.]|nr:MAG: hypothetical protein DHS20C05_19640 [Marinicaulis sp.]